jgi:Flp pilus assembly protein TadG
MNPNHFNLLERLHRLRRNQLGTALIETAISLPLFCLMLLGAAEFARLAYASIEVTNAARAGAEYGAYSHGTASDSAGVTTAATADAANLTGLTVTNISLSCACSNSTYTPSGCSDNTTCESNNTAMVETITVNTQATYDPLIHYPGGPLSMTLTGQASETVSNQ